MLFFSEEEHKIAKFKQTVRYYLNGTEEHFMHYRKEVRGIKHCPLTTQTQLQVKDWWRWILYLEFRVAAQARFNQTGAKVNNSNFTVKRETDNKTVKEEVDWDGDVSNALVEPCVLWQIKDCLTDRWCVWRHLEWVEDRTDCFRSTSDVLSCVDRSCLVDLSLDFNNSFWDLNSLKIKLERRYYFVTFINFVNTWFAVSRWNSWCGLSACATLSSKIFRLTLFLQAHHSPLATQDPWQASFTVACPPALPALVLRHKVNTLSLLHLPNEYGNQSLMCFGTWV